MDVLNGKMKTIYFKYLAATFGGTMIPCVYSMVDMSVVGNYHGPDGTATLAIFSPLWNIVYGLGLMAGIGGSVLFSTVRGMGNEHRERSNKIFTSTILVGSIFSLVVWFVVGCFQIQLFQFFGAKDMTLFMAQAYLKPILPVFPLFLFNQIIAAFLRNDGNPQLATAAVLSGGIFNILGDCLFVVHMNKGIFGAGLATAIGCVISFAIMMTHFGGKKNTLRLV